MGKLEKNSTTKKTKVVDVVLSKIYQETIKVSLDDKIDLSSDSDYKAFERCILSLSRGVLRKPVKEGFKIHTSFEDDSKPIDYEIIDYSDLSEDKSNKYYQSVSL